MIIFITVIILIACAVLAFFILVQNPKGGGLSGSFGSMSSQIMGVKQSGDVMEKGTWTIMGLIGALCIISVMFLEKPKKSRDVIKQSSGQTSPKQAPASGK
ncbi:MAG: preprotein translocase subunit SecG [Chitinophagaceae bacterium]|nr:preprotein translocase subunit SecG [Chitinophagaceae bacterium]